MNFDKIEKINLSFKEINKLDFDVDTFKDYMLTKPSSHDPTVENNNTTLSEDIEKAFKNDFLKNISGDNPVKNLISLEKWIVKTLIDLLKPVMTLVKRDYKEAEKDIINNVLNSFNMKPQCSLKEIFEFFKTPLIDAKFNSDYDFKHNKEATIKFKTGHIDYDEFNNIVLKMDGSKFTDNLGLSFNMVKYIECIHSYIIEQFNGIIDKPEYGGHEEWANAVLFVKYKGAGDTTVPNNFRPIVSLNIITRLFNRIIGFRLYNYLFDNVIIDGTIQRGLISNRNGVLENTLLLKNTFLHAKTNEKPLTVTFLDIKKAYNSIKLETILFACKKYNIPDYLTNYLKHYYLNIKTNIYMNKETSDYFKWNNGILQGCSLANIIFIMCFNLVIAEINERFKDVLTDYSYNDKIFMLAFVDDLVIFTKTKTQMNEVLKVAYDIIENCGMEINKSKSQYYDINTPDDDSPVVNDIIRLKEDEPFRYLGCWMVPNCDEKTSFEKYKTMFKEKIEEIDGIEPPAFFKSEHQITSFRLNLFSRLYQKTTWDLQRLNWENTEFITEIIEIEKEYMRKWINTEQNPHKFNEKNWDQKTARRCKMCTNIKDKSIILCESDIMFDFIAMNNNCSTVEDTKKYIETRKGELDQVFEDANNDYYGDIAL